MDNTLGCRLIQRLANARVKRLGRIEFLSGYGFVQLADGGSE